MIRHQRILARDLERDVCIRQQSHSDQHIGPSVSAISRGQPLRESGGSGDDAAGLERYLTELKDRLGQVPTNLEDCEKGSRESSQLRAATAAQVRELLNERGRELFDVAKWKKDAMKQRCFILASLGQKSRRIAQHTVDGIRSVFSDDLGGLREIAGYLLDRNYYVVTFYDPKDRLAAETAVVFARLGGDFLLVALGRQQFLTPSYIGACLPRWPWIERIELGWDTLEAIESTKTAACTREVRGTIRRIRDSLFMDGLVEPAGPYDGYHPEPEGLASWRCAPTMLWPTIASGPSDTISGWSSIVPGQLERGIPHFVVFSPGHEKKEAKDQLLVLDERTLQATPILRASAGERLLLLGRSGGNALLLITGSELRLRLVDGSGAMRGEHRLPAPSAEALKGSSGEPAADVYEPLGTSQFLLMLEQSYLVTIQGATISAVALGLNGRLVRNAVQSFLVVGKEECIDLHELATERGKPLLAASDFKGFPKTSCPTDAMGVPWYEHLPLPVDGIRKPFVASVAGCLVRSAIRLPLTGLAPTDEGDGDPLEAFNRPNLSRQAVRLNVNSSPMDPTLDVELSYSGGRFGFGVGDFLPQYNNQHLIFRVAIPPRAIEQLRPGSGRTDHLVKLHYPGKTTYAFPTWPNDCHEGSLLFRTNHTMTPYYLMYGYCE